MGDSHAVNGGNQAEAGVEAEPLTIEVPKEPTVSIPDIPSNATQDLEPVGNAETVSAGDDPDKKHKRQIETVRLLLAIVLVIISVAIVVTLTLIQFFNQELFRESSGLSSAISWMQGLAATAAGFAFGRFVSDTAKSD